MDTPPARNEQNYLLDKDPIVMDSKPFSQDQLGEKNDKALSFLTWDDAAKNLSEHTSATDTKVREIKATRLRCVSWFISSELFPILSSGEPISKDDLIRLASEGKDKWGKDEGDLGEDFYLIQEVDRELFLRALGEVAHRSEDNDLINQATDFIGLMLSEYPDELYEI